MHDVATAIGAIATAVIGLAALAVFVSQNAQTPTIITNAGTAFSSVIQAAVAPVSSGNSVMNTSGMTGNSNGSYVT
jgi:hypothetical protein